MITEEEKLNRQNAVQFEIDNNRLEGLVPDEIFIEITNDWANGKITNEEFGRKVYEIHGLRFPTLMKMVY